MAVNTILMDFSIDPTQIKTDAQQSTVCNNIENILRDYLSNLKALSTMAVDGGVLKVYQSDKGAVTSLRVYGNGVITLSLDYYKGEQQEALLSFERCNKIECEVKERVLGMRQSQSLVALRRGICGRFMQTSDERILEYDIDKIIFEQKTPFQKVSIVHSKTLGNMLVLDDLQNIAESDLIYTETLMGRGIEDYKNKEIVILGGGDGALLYELLKEQPKHVMMLEIDETVMSACAKHMRSICGDVLDKMEGPNYKIIIGDCMKSLDQFIKEGRKFDYVFGDLTDIPISTTPTGELWQFIHKILEKSLKILKPDGKFMTHGNGSGSTESLKMYESQLSKLEPPVKMTKSEAFVPSFMESWIFYQIKFA